MTHSDGLPMPRRGRAALAIWLAMAVTVMDTAIANVALPTIARDLGAPASDSFWVVQAYQLGIICSLLAWSALGERWGYNRIYVIGQITFTAASIACAASTSLSELIAARLAQGLGAGAIMGVNGALVRFTFPKANLGWALGFNVTVIAVSATVAPIIAGLVLSGLSWRYLFAVNLLLGTASLAAGWRSLPEARGTRQTFDWASALLLALALSSIVAGPTILHWKGILPVAAGIGIVWWLGRKAAAQSNPLLPFDLWALPELRRAYLASVGSFAAQSCLLVSLPFHLMRSHGLSPTLTGFTMASIPLGLAVAAPISGRLSDRGNGIGRLGLPLAATGGLCIGLAPSGSVPLLFAFGLVGGMGFGLFQAPNNRLMLTAAPRPRSGSAAGMAAMARLLGQMSGVAAASAVLALSGALSSAFTWIVFLFAGAGATAAWPLGSDSQDVGSR